MKGRAVDHEQMPPSYLAPYVKASRRHGAGFGTLLWASPHTQALRFEAIRRIHNLNGLSLLDVGCGRADLLDYLLDREVEPHDYIGLEAVDALADAAESKHHNHCTIVRCDFIAEPARLFVGADIVVFCGSLNTMDRRTFYQCIRTAYQASAQGLIFNFLSSPALAAADYLNWYRPADVMRYAQSISRDVRRLEDYIDGDCTILMKKEKAMENGEW